MIRRRARCAARRRGADHRRQQPRRHRHVAEAVGRDVGWVHVCSSARPRPAWVTPTGPASRGVWRATSTCSSPWTPISPTIPRPCPALVAACASRRRHRRWARATFPARRSRPAGPAGGRPSRGGRTTTSASPSTPTSPTTPRLPRLPRPTSSAASDSTTRPPTVTPSRSRRCTGPLRSAPSIREIPIVFTERATGHSKLSGAHDPGGAGPRHLVGYPRTAPAARRRRSRPAGTTRLTTASSAIDRGQFDQRAGRRRAGRSAPAADHVWISGAGEAARCARSSGT